MSDWQDYSLAEFTDIRVSNVDKKTKPNEEQIRLCNYMDVYVNDYITADLDFMESTASPPEYERFKVDKGDVVITKDSETPYDIGIPSVVVDEIENLVCGYHLALIKPNPKIVNSVFLSKQLSASSVASYFSRVAAGSTRYGLSNGAIARTKVSLPPLVKQDKIAKILQTVDRAIAHTEALIEKYQQIKAGLMHDLFTRGIGADGKLRPPRDEAPELYQESAICWIPREWNVVSLSHISDIVRGSTPRPARDPRYFDGNFIPWITVGELSREDWPYLYRTETMLTELGSSFSRVLPKGTLVISNSGYGCGVPKILHITGCANDGVAAFLNLDKSCDQLFLYYKIYSQIMTLRKKVARGNDQPNLNTDMLGEFRVALPCELEQGKIAEIIWKIDTKIQSERNSLEKFKLKKLGLMQDLLSGKVPVKVDSNEVDHI